MNLNVMPAEPSLALPAVSPRDGGPLEPVRAASPTEVLQVVAMAREAQAVWSQVAPRERGARLRKARGVLLDLGERLAEVALAELGKSTAETLTGEVIPSADLFPYWAKQGPALLEPQVASLNPINFPRKTGTTELVPKGVVAVIAPWNYPISLPLRTIAPALAAGNAVVLKPSEYAPRTTAVLMQIFDVLGVPGLVGMVQGGPEVGAQLVEAGVHHVAFTGSVQAGCKVAAMCADRLIGCSLELGGKDAALVLEDASLERTVEGTVWGAFANAGQNCAAVERVFVVEAIAQRYIEAVIARTERLVVGKAGLDTFDVGPLVRPAGLATVEQHVADAVAHGATIRTGGQRTGHGNHFAPTVLTDVTEDMAVMTRETFGPVLPISIVRDANEAVARANQSVYGLTASIWSEDLERAAKLARRLRAGVVTINNHAFTAALPHAPWHGLGESGGGVTNSKYAFYDLVQPRYVLVDRARQRELWWFPHTEALATLALALTRLFGRAKGKLGSLVTVLRTFPKRWKA